MKIPIPEELVTMLTTSMFLMKTMVDKLDTIVELLVEIRDQERAK